MSTSKTETYLALSIHFYRHTPEFNLSNMYLRFFFFFKTEAIDAYCFQFYYKHKYKMSLLLLIGFVRMAISQ